MPVGFHAVTPYKLQWGRDVIVADGRPDTASCRRAASFNGAATLSSRMGERAQGRVFLGDASMGPRRYRRGWSAAGGTSHITALGFNGAATLSSRMDVAGDEIEPYFLLLQWGRDVIVADGRISSSSAPSLWLLQWGRDVIVADGRREPGRRESGRRASMGPRRYRRGWSRPRNRTRRASRSFNGAATLSSRMGTSLSGSRKSAGSLQWGRDVIVADG